MTVNVSVRREVRKSSAVDAFPTLEEANRRWECVLDHDPNCEQALLQLVSNCLFAGETATADSFIAMLYSLPSIDNRSRMLELQARRSELDGNVEESMEAWRRVAEGGGNSDAAFTHVARLALSAGLPAYVHVALDRLSANAAGSEFVRILRARAFSRQDRWSCARDAIGTIDQYVSRCDAAIEVLFRCYCADRRLVNAHEIFASSRVRSRVLGDYYLGRVDFHDAEYGKACDRFSRSVETSSHGDSKVWLIRTLCSMGRLREVEAYLAKFASDDSIDRVTLARCQEAAGWLEAAGVSRLRHARESGTSRAWDQLVQFHFGYRDWGRAWCYLLEAEAAERVSAQQKQLAQVIRESVEATGERLPACVLEARSFAFSSSERLVDAMVDRLLETRPDRMHPSTATSGSTIVLVINSLGPGGAERQIVNLANGIVARHLLDRVILLCTHLSRADQDRFYLDQVDSRIQVVEYYDREGIRAARDVPSLEKYADLVEHVQPKSRRTKLIELAVALDDLQPDVVHGWLDETFINTALVGSMLGIPRIVGRWGSMPPGVARTTTELDRNNIAYLESAYKSIARLPDLVLSANSRLTADAYASLMGVRPESVHVVYNGIDDRVLEADAVGAGAVRSDLGIAPSATIVGTVFRMTEEKRPLLWVEVAASLFVQHPDWHFVVVGAGPMRNEMERLAHSKGLCNLHFVGKQRNVGAWFGAFDVMLLTSRVEGVSNAIVESQMCACPVVAANVGGLSEAMEEWTSGRLLENPDATCYAGAVTGLLADRERFDAIRASAREFALNKFGIDEMVASYRRLFGFRAEEVGPPAQSVPPRIIKPVTVPGCDQAI